MVFNRFVPRIQESLTYPVSVFLFKFSYQSAPFSFQILLILNLFTSSRFYSHNHVQLWLLKLLFNFRTKVTIAYLIPQLHTNMLSWSGIAYHFFFFPPHDSLSWNQSFQVSSFLVGGLKSLCRLRQHLFSRMSRYTRYRYPIYASENKFDRCFQLPEILKGILAGKEKENLNMSGSCKIKPLGLTLYLAYLE